MSLCQEVEMEIGEVISIAIKKINGRTDKDLCKYIPSNAGGGYMHHFTLRKMKTRHPQELRMLIDKFIIWADKPAAITPKQRASRGSRKNHDQLKLTRNQLERMLNIARLAGDKEMIAMLAPKKSLGVAKRELIISIRHGKVEPELWNAYVESSSNFILHDSLSVTNSPVTS